MRQRISVEPFSPGRFVSPMVAFLLREPSMSIHPKLVGRSCYHRYEIDPGFFTPGQYLEVDPKCCLDELGLPQSLLGLRALDIGAWDGPFTFELERRGAQVT